MSPTPLYPADQGFDTLFYKKVSAKDRSAILKYYIHDISIPPEPYHTVLEAAPHIGDHVLVKFLLETNPNIDTLSEPDRYGNALLLASSGDCRETVKLLLDHGADLQFRKMCGGEYKSSLDVAWNSDSKEVATEIFERLEIPKYWGTEVHRAFCMASQDGDGARVEVLIRKVIDVNYQDYSYGPALVHPVIGGSIEIVETLLKYGARVNTECYEFGCPLKAAIEGGGSKMVELLLRSNAVVDFSEIGNPLLSAAKKGDLEIVKLLIDRGFHVNIEGYKYGTPIFAAALYGHEDVASYLLERGAKVDIAIETARRKDWHLTEIRTVSKRLKAYESNIKQIKSPSRRDVCLYMWKFISKWSSAVVWKNVTLLQTTSKWNDSRTLKVLRIGRCRPM